MNEIWQNADLNTADLPLIERGEFHHHPKRYLNYKNTAATIFWIIPVVAYLILTLLFPDTWSYVIGIALIVLMFLSFFGIYIGFKRRSYALREKDITYKKGWIFYSTTTIPFNRIQHSEVAQGPLEQRYGLSTLKIYTAGGSSSDLAIPGLVDDEAQSLRDFISKKAATYA